MKMDSIKTVRQAIMAKACVGSQFPSLPREMGSQYAF